MKDYSIVLFPKEIARRVYELSAHAAKERGDAKHVATQDNEALIAGFVKDAVEHLTRAVGVYHKGTTVGDDDVSIDFCMPANWSEGWLPERDAQAFAAFYAVAKWFEISGMDGAVFMAKAQESIGNIGYSLNRRMKPL